MEPIYTQKYTVCQNHLDLNGRVKPAALLGFALDAAGKHCVALNADWDTLAQKGMFWAVIRHRLLISRYPENGEVLTVETWPMPTTRSAYPRAAVAYNHKGNEVFRLVSLWVLMDINARTMILPGKSGVTVDGILRGNEPEPPMSIPPRDLEHTACRQVATEDMDRNQHMTNTRYLEWIQDLQTPEFHREHPAKEIVICYLSEALFGQELTLNWELTPEGFLQADGRREETDGNGKTTRIFSAKVYL